MSSHLAILAGSELSLGILLLPASFVMVTAQLQAKLASQMPCVVDADSCPLSCPSHTCRPLLLVPFYRWAVVGLKLLGDREKYIGVQDRTRKNNWNFLSRISRASLVLHWEGCACWYFPKVVGGAHNYRAVLCSSVAQERGVFLPLVCVVCWSRLNCPWKGRPGKINPSGLSEVVEGGETSTSVSSRMVIGDCIGTLSVKVRHQNFMV